MKLRSLIEIEYGSQYLLADYEDQIKKISHEQYRKLQLMMSQKQDNEVAKWIKNALESGQIKDIPDDTPPNDKSTPLSLSTTSYEVDALHEDDKAANLWNKYKGKIFADTDVERRTRRSIQTAVLTDPQYAIKWIEKWAAKNDEDYEHPDDWPPKDKALGEEYCPDCRAKLREIVKKTIAECWKTHKQVGMKKKGGKTVPNCVPKNEGSSWDGSASKNPGMWDGKPSEKGQPFPAVGEAKTKPAKGKRFAKKVKGKGGRTRTVSYGQAGKAKKGGDRIRPGTAKGHAYCARSAKIKKCKNPPCANTLSRKKWKCQGSRSVPE